MRVMLLLASLLLASTGFSEQPTVPVPDTFARILKSQKFVTFSLDRNAMMYRLGLLENKTLEASKKYYENRSENVKKHRELMYEVLKERNHSTSNRSQPIHVPTQISQPETELEREMNKYARPTGSPVGAVTRVGLDYVAVKELGSTTEYVIPFNRILDLPVPSGLQETPTTTRASE